MSNIFQGDGADTISDASECDEEEDDDLGDVTLASDNDTDDCEEEDDLGDVTLAYEEDEEADTTEEN